MKLHTFEIKDVDGEKFEFLLDGNHLKGVKSYSVNREWAGTNNIPVAEVTVTFLANDIEFCHSASTKPASDQN